MQLDHINISAPMELLQRVRDFYCQILGLREGHRPGFSRPGFWLYAGDRPQVHLIESEESCERGGMGYLDHVAFRTTDLEGLIERLESRGIPYRRSYRADSGMTQIFFQDPAGTLLEINSIGGAEQEPARPSGRGGGEEG